VIIAGGGKVGYQLAMTLRQRGAEVLVLEKKLYLTEKTAEVKDILLAYDLHEAKKNRKQRRKGGKRRSVK
jgi:2-polyprenyl-6-methoxyphenol hydroxylase-like FAD-dependent oxidoreductase